jgi:hypothetical protein
MSRRKRPEGELMSLDTFLNICTIAVGGLVLVALVTVLGVGEVSVGSGGVAMAAPAPTATRVLFEAVGGQLYLVDEEGLGKKVREAAANREGGPPTTTAAVMAMLLATDVGDARHRITAEESAHGLAWVYERRDDAPGDDLEGLKRGDSELERALASMDADHFAYFVVHEDSFEVFRVARERAAARGVAIGWHPVVAGTPLRLGTGGSLGRRVQ